MTNLTSDLAKALIKTRYILDRAQAVTHRDPSPYRVWREIGRAIGTTDLAICLIPPNMRRDIEADIQDEYEEKIGAEQREESA